MAAPPKRTRLDWPPIIHRAAEIVASYDTATGRKACTHRWGTAT